MKPGGRTSVSGLALVLAAGLAFTSVAARADTAPQPSKPVIIGSLSGAYLAARTAETDNDLDNAITFYQKALSYDPSDENLQQNLLLALISKGRFNEAIPVAEKLKAVPDAERYSRLVLGVDAIRAKQFRSAETYFKLAVGSDLDTLLTGILSGWAKAGSGKPQDAIAQMEGLDGPAWYTLFRNYHAALVADQANMPDAGKRYQAVIDDRASGGAAPDTWMRALEAYASWLARNGRTNEALALLDKGEEVASGRPGYVAMRADIKAGTPVRPLTTNAQQGAAEMLLNLATALNRPGGENFVRLYLEYARALDPKNDMVLVTLGSISEKQSLPSDAIAYYEQLPAGSPYRRLAELQLGLNLADMDQTDKAIDHLEKAIAEDVNDMRAYLALAGVYSAKENYAKTAEVLDRAVEKRPMATEDDLNLFYRRGIAYERLKQWDKAEPNFKRALQLYPDQPNVLNYLGYSWVDMNINLEEGLAMIRKAVDLKPDDGYIVDSLGWAYYRLGRFEEAVKELQRAVSLRPEDPTINDHLGDAYWRVGRKLEATFQWSQARDLKADGDLIRAIAQKLTRGLPPLDDKDAVAVPEKPAAEDGKG